MPVIVGDLGDPVGRLRLAVLPFLTARLDWLLVILGKKVG